MQHKHPWEEFFLGHQAEPSLVLPTQACQRWRWGWEGGAGRNRKAGSGPECKTLGVERAFGQGCCLVVSPTLCLTWLWASRWGGPTWKAPRFWPTLSIREEGGGDPEDTTRGMLKGGMGMGQGRGPKLRATEESSMIPSLGHPVP